MRKIVKYLIFVAISICILSLTYPFLIRGNCSTEHLDLLEQIRQYEKTFNPETCDDLLEKIIELNEKCDIEIEPLDCG